jgi:hypothetical protein
MSTPASDQNENSKMKKLTSGNVADPAIRLRWQRRYCAKTSYARLSPASFCACFL